MLLLGLLEAESLQLFNLLKDFILFSQELFQLMESILTTLICILIEKKLGTSAKNLLCSKDQLKKTSYIIIKLMMPPSINMLKFPTLKSLSTNGIKVTILIF